MKLRPTSQRVGAPNTMKLEGTRLLLISDDGTQAIGVGDIDKFFEKTIGAHIIKLWNVDVQERSAE